MIVALVGGALPAVVAVIGGFLLANWFFVPPYYGLDISSVENVLALAVYVAAAGIVAVLVDRVGRSRLHAARLQAEAEALASLAGSLTQSGTVGDLLTQLRLTFGYRAAALLARASPGWHVLASSGVEPPSSVDAADVSRDLGRGTTLVLAGGSMTGEDERVLNAFAAQVAAAAERVRLEGEAGRAADLAATNTVRAGLLQAVSHDLRTPLASIKASISSLRQRDIEWSSDVGGGVPGDDRGGDRPPGRHHRQPARHQPPPGGGAGRRRATGRRRGGRPRRPRQPRADRAGDRGRRPRAPARRPRRRGPARAGGRQPRQQRRALLAGRRAGPGVGRRRGGRRQVPRRRARRRPRSGHPACGPRAGVPTVPAGRRPPGRRCRRRPRPGHRARLHRGDGR